MRNYRCLTKEGKWVYGDVIYANDTTYIFDKNHGSFVDDTLALAAYNLYEVIPKTVGQFTGECEKYSNVKIYAGDIVEFTFKHGFVGALQTKTVRGVVEFRACQYWVEDFPLMRAIDENGEVIGNIHENPELLKEEQ